MNWLASPARYDNATFQRCGRSGLDLPRISLGLWHNFGDTDAFATGRATVRRAFDRGITHLISPITTAHHMVRLKKISGGFCIKICPPTEMS